MVTVLLGPPACGKGTQAQRLQSELGWRAYSTGAAIRDHVERRTDYGLRCAEAMAKAYLLPDELVMELVRADLAAETRPVALDGFPRTLEQAGLLDEWLESEGKFVVAVIYLAGSAVELEPRVVARLTCPSCGFTGREGCDKLFAGAACGICGTPLVHRSDDTPEIFRRRYVEFEEKTLPLVDFYASRGILHEIPALLGSDAIYKRILELPFIVGMSGNSEDGAPN